MKRFVRNLEIRTTEPTVRFLFEEMYRQQVSHYDVSVRAGFHRDTLRNWRTRNTPRVNDLEAVLNYLGYTLKVVKMKGE